MWVFMHVLKIYYLSYCLNIINFLSFWRGNIFQLNWWKNWRKQRHEKKCGLCEIKIQNANVSGENFYMKEIYRNIKFIQLEFIKMKRIKLLKDLHELKNFKYFSNEISIKSTVSYSTVSCQSPSYAVIFKCLKAPIQRQFMNYINTFPNKFSIDLQ